MSQIIDNVVKEWGERLYYETVKGRLTKRTVTRSKAVSVPRPMKVSGSARLRQKLALTTRKAPEVMVKISGGGKGMRQIKAHLDYISRNGLVALENEDGQIITGREAVRDLRDEWKHGQYGIPEDARFKEAFNIVLSMPPGTDRDGVKDAARIFAGAEFGMNYAYVFAAHDDEKHPHVHLCVKSLGFDGARLNPRKADLQRWRERFAEALHERGIEANATPRASRGVGQKSIVQAELHMKKEDRPARARADHSQPTVVAQDKFSVNPRTVHAYGQIAKALVMGSADDRQLALAITGFVSGLPGISAPRQQVHVADRKKSGQNQETQVRTPSDSLDRTR